MFEPPETRYARSGDVHLAYQVLGEGPIDLVLFGTFVSHVELIWDEPEAADLLRRLASFSRLILFDKRGVGMSDPLPTDSPPTLEERLEDVRAVMDSAGSEQAVLFGNSEGGQLAIMFATTYPARTHSIVLMGSFARVRRSDDYPIGVPGRIFEQLVQLTRERWGTPQALGIILPSVVGDAAKERRWTQFFRRSTSPGSAVTQLRMNWDTDVRHLLPLVQVPTLVLHAGGDRWVRANMGQHLADDIPGARFVELPGSDHLPFAELGPRVAEEVREFITGARAPVSPERVLATVLFTDIVGSTERAAAEGDERWRRLITGHDRDVHRQIERFGGDRIQSTGDGFLAVFDGPARAIRCASAVHGAARAHGLEVRIGIHTGEVELVGDDEVAGIAVHIGARVADRAGAGEVLVSGGVPPLVVGSGIEFVDRGTYELKGVPGEWRLLAVGGGEPSEAPYGPGP